MKLTRTQAFIANIEIDTSTGCWIWGASLQSQGYGQFWDGSRVVKAHRWAFANLGKRAIPAGYQLDHTRLNYRATRNQCSRACVNPAHLEAVTQKENAQRSEYLRESGRKNGRKLGRELGLSCRKYPLPEGVSRNRNKFSAKIWKNGKSIHLGTYESPELASKVYQDYKKEGHEFI